MGRDGAVWHGRAWQAEETHLTCWNTVNSTPDRLFPHPHPPRRNERTHTKGVGALTNKTNNDNDDNLATKNNKYKKRNKKERKKEERR